MPQRNAQWVAMGATRAPSVRDPKGRTGHTARGTFGLLDQKARPSTPRHAVGEWGRTPATRPRAHDTLPGHGAPTHKRWEHGVVPRPPLKTDGASQRTAQSKMQGRGQGCA